MEANRSAAGYLLPLESLNKVFACTTHWKEVEGDLRAVYHSCDTGVALCGSAVQELNRHVVEDEVEKTVGSLEGTHITQDSIDAAKKTFVDVAKALGENPMESYPKPLVVQITYRHTSVSQTAVSTINHFNKAVAALVKSVGVENGQLDPIGCESDLCDSGQHVRTTVADDLLIPYKAVRKAVNAGLAGEENPTSDQLAKVFKNKTKFLNKLDKTISIEAAFFEACSGEVGEGRVRDRMLAAFPKAPGGHTLDKTLQSLRELAETKLVKWCGVGLQSTLQVVTDVVATILAGRPPKPSFFKTSGEFMSKITLALKNHCVYQEKAADGTLKQQRVGKEAAREFFEVVAAHDLKGNLTMPMMKELYMWGWMLSEAEQERISVFEKKVVKTAVGHHAGAGAKAKQKAKEVDAKSLVASLFKKSSK